MPSRKKQKLSKEEKARRKVKSHSSKEELPEWKNYDFSRKYDGVVNRANKKNISSLMLESVFDKYEIVSL